MQTLFAMNFSSLFKTLIVSIFIVIVVLFLFKDRIISSLAFFPDKTTLPLPRYHFLDEIYISTKDNIKLHAYYLKHKNAKKVILYFHGNAGNSSHRIDEVMHLFKMGHEVLLVDYRGYGKSEGKISEAGLYRDAQAGLDFLLQTYEEKNIYILGRSIGSVAAVDVAQKKNLGGIILATPVSSAADMAKNMGLGLIGFLVNNNLNNLNKIKNIKSKTLFICGTKDEITPLKFCKKLYNTYNNQKELLVIEQAEHNNISTINSQEYWDKIENFILK